MNHCCPDTSGIDTLYPDTPDARLETADLPIGLFDSGVGGLTVLAAMQQRMPGEDYLYLGDTARLPYGTKSPETIIKYAVQAASRLVALRIKLLVVACNTATAAALPTLREVFPDIPVIGVVEPGAHAACQVSTGGHIAVIATEATVQGGAYQEAILRRRPDASVVSRACPLFVPIAEEGLFDGPIVEGIAEYYLVPLLQDSVTLPDCLVLGCTHYPLLASAIRKVVGGNIRLVDSAATTAEAVQLCLDEEGLPHAQQQDRTGVTRFFTTDDIQRFARTGSLFLGTDIREADVSLIDL
ncbi:MAG: glutamate racemase [Bilophila sp.]